MAWYPPTITVAASSEPVTLTEAKAQLRVDGADEDTMIGGLIAAARDYVERYTGAAIVSRTVAAKCDTFADFSTVPVLPMGAISSISYVDSAGSAQTLSSDVYEARSDGLAASIALKAGQSWPAIQNGSRITVTMAAGYSTVPASIKHAILLLVGDWYAVRENTATGTSQPVEMPHAVTALLENYRSFAA